MQSTFDFDKVFAEIVCEKEAEINKLKKIIEQLEICVSKQEKVKIAKDTFISRMANIIQSNNSFPRDGKSWRLGRLGILKKINKIIDFIDLFHISWMLNVAKSLREDLLICVSEDDIYNFERWSHQYPDHAKHVASTINSKVKTFNTYNEISGYGDDNSNVFNMGDIVSELWCSSYDDNIYRYIGIIGGHNTLRILNQIMHAIHDYLDAIIKDME